MNLKVGIVGPEYYGGIVQVYGLICECLGRARLQVPDQDTGTSKSAEQNQRNLFESHETSEVQIANACQ
jgi:hypothetical protein